MTTAAMLLPPLCWNKDIGPSCEKLNELVSNKHKQLSRAKMIVFDKDGTIGNCKPTYLRWSRHMTQKLQAALLENNNNKTPKPSSPSRIRSSLERFHNSIGWDSTQNDVLPSSILLAGTWDEILSTTAAVLAEEAGESLLLMETQQQEQQQENPFLDCVQMWHNELDDLHGSDEPMIPELKDMLQCCQKEFHYRVAVCTSDDRNPTDTALTRWDVLRNNIVQYSICGDEIEYSKPSAQPLQALCEQTTTGSSGTMISPQECIVVGDTPADTGMAKNAGAAFCIGVLTGGCTATLLTETGADIILPDVGHIPSLLRTMQNIIKKESNKKQTAKK